MTPISPAALRRWARNDVITARRLKALGHTREEIRASRARSHLFDAFSGVFFLDADPSDLARWTAAVARGGPHALLSHGPAAALWRLIERWYGEPHITVRRGGPKDVDGIRVHWTTRPTDRAVIHGIPVTTLHRTLDDYARTATPEGIKRALRQAEYHHALDLSLLGEEATAGPLRRVLRDYVHGQGMTTNELEADFFELVATRTALPLPEVQADTEGGRVDFLFTDLNLVVEVDGYQAHRGRIAFAADRARDREHVKAGRVPLRFTWQDVQLAPAAVADDLTSAASSLSTLSRTKS